MLGLYIVGGCWMTLLGKLGLAVAGEAFLAWSVQLHLEI